MTVPAKSNTASASAVENVIALGDLSKLTSDQRVSYYTSVCQSLGLNPLTQPFEFLTLNGKLVLYAKRGAADQLRKVNNISLEIVSRDVAEDVLTIHVRARTPDGRTDEDLGAVPFPATLKGDARVNAELKAVTKAKRRVTLSICGLGILDESEIESIPAGVRKPPRPAPNVMLPPHDPATGEIHESADSPADAAPAQAPPPAMPAGAATIPVEAMAREAAMRGRDAINAYYSSRSPMDKRKIDAIRPELNRLVDEAEAFDAV